jgi:hypothetical protein
MSDGLPAIEKGSLTGCKWFATCAAMIPRPEAIGFDPRWSI